MDNKKDVAVIILNFKSWQETIQEADICNKFLGINYENIIIVGKINGIKYLPCTPSTYDN